MSGEQDIAALFARANAADFEAATGHRLYGARRRKRGPCPLCGASAHKKHDGAFAWDEDARRWRCWSCGEGGDLVALVARLRNLAPMAAARELANDPQFRAPARSIPLKAVDPRPPSRRPAEIWAATRPARGTIAETYLRARGLCGRPLTAALAVLRFHPECPWGDIAGVYVHAPAMVCRAMGPAGPLEGVHCTYLKPDGSGKTARSPAKRMWGPQRDGEGRPGGVFLRGPRPQAPILVGEGLESTLSAAMLIGIADHWDIVATLSLGALQGGALADRFGRIDPSMPSADPERAPFTWPGCLTVMIAVDRDMKPGVVRARALHGGTARIAVDSDMRASLCGALAAQAWRRAGATTVDAIAPRGGRDFNDELRCAA